MADQHPTSPDAADHLSHFSNADYDWMGVLDQIDGCFGHSMDGHESQGDVIIQGGGETEGANNDPGTDSNASATIIDGKTANEIAALQGHSTAVSEDTAPQDANVAEQPPTSRTASAKEDDSKPSSSPKGSEEACTKAIDRIERKRNREKQRRLDTNSQFTALAAIVREIETTDFMEEAQLNSLYELTQPSQTADADSNKKLKSDTSFPGGTIQNTISTTGTYSASNRVELIARTTLMLSQFRDIRKKRNAELRDARRQNCEMKKEVEDLRRMVAHYKAVGMGQQKPQDKIMMMVPMMVPQDAVNSVSAGFPAAHLMGGAGFAPQWTPTAMAPGMPTHNISTAFHQQASQGSQSTSATFAQLPSNQSAHNQTSSFQFHTQQGTTQSPGVATLPQSNMMQGQAYSFQVPGMQIAHDGNPSSTGHSNPQQFAQASVPTQLNMPSLSQGLLQPQQAFNMLNPAMGMMFPHTNATTAPVGLPNTQSLVNTPAPQTTDQPSSDKPSPSAHQGGGGNLAHCA